MTIRVYNTMGRKKEVFEPLEPGKVSMYVCGPTVYDSCHIGHARSVVVFDVIVRYFKAKGFDVTYVRNFTDVDDKIINKANQLGMDCKAVAEMFIKEFYEDMDALNVERATIEPKATDHIDSIIQFIEKLIHKGLAYRINGDVYYSVEKFENYGKLSGRKLEDMEAGARVDIDERKQNPFDFALWKSAKPDEPSWESPWGKGRPGWHIECSAMGYEFLGETFDIHGGGKDLSFPHHENEIAQSEGVFKKPFVKYWIHNGFVNIDKEKMSKSLGNFLMIKDVLKKYHPEAVRLFLLSNHYRSPVDYTQKAIEESESGLNKLYTLLKRVEDTVELQMDSENSGGVCWNRFCEAMDDDFNTARGIGILFDAVHRINRILDNDQMSSESIQKVRSSYADILKTGNILGILCEPARVYFDKKNTQTLESKSIDPAKIDKMVEERIAARKAKDWAEADRIRQQLADMGITVEDRPDGTIWKTG